MNRPEPWLDAILAICIVVFTLVMGVTIVAGGVFAGLRLLMWFLM